MPWSHFYENFLSEIEKCGRKSSQVQIIAVSKGQNSKHVQSVLSEAPEISQLGENYFQELREKREFFSGETLSVKWNYLGALQSKKIKELCRLADCLHSVTREKELQLLSQQKEESLSIPDFYFQVNISGEKQKSGVSFDHARELVERAEDLSLSSSFLGFMGVASQSEESLVRGQFAKLRQFRDQYFPGKKLNMGMSGDYPWALSEGSDVIRVGSLIFGERNYRI